MDITQIPDILINAATALAPAGTTVMEGALSAAGESLFNTVKDWFKNKTSSNVPGALEDLRQHPGDAGRQNAVRSELSAQTATLASSPGTDELLRLCAALHVLTAEKPTLTVQWTESGINIGSIKTEKSMVVTHLTGNVTF